MTSFCAVLLFDRETTIGMFGEAVDMLNDAGADILLSEAAFVSEGLSVEVSCPEDCWERFEVAVSEMEGVAIDWDAMAEDAWDDPEVIG